MYQASAAFHAAAMAEEAGTLLLQFADGTLLTTEDVGNIEITYPLNEETDVTVGKCVSAELRCTVLNYHGLLSGYGFGRCSVSMGVMVGTEEWAMPVCKAAVVHGYGTDSAATISAHEDAPFLRVNGSAGSSQPTFSPDCLVLMGDALYAGDGTNLWAATIDGSALTEKAVDNDFLAYKLGQWSGRGISYQGKMAYEFADAVYKYEYVPLGTFYFDTPEQRRVANISCEALDGMQLFNVDVDDWWASLQWPLTRGQLLQSLCTYVGVTLKTTTFPGSTTSIASAPMAGNGFVGKDVLGWIAETACSYARMSRDGGLELVWFATQSVKLTQNQHFGDSPAEYETPAVEALHVMVANTDLGVMLPENGSGNEYQVLDNPLYYGSTETEIRGKAQDLYNRLVAFPAYTPNSVDAVCDWSIEPGDIIQVVGGDGTTRTLPIFRMTLKWAGGWARATYECTGGTGRKPATQSKRREFAAYRAYHKLEVDISGVKSEIGDVQGNVANLEITASELRTQINGKIDGTEAQSLIDQTVDKISLEVSSGSGGSSFVLKKDGVEISSDTLDLHVKSVNVDGDITANAINLSTANITGVLAAQYIDIENATIRNAQIESLYASKIIGGSVGGYVASGAISDAGHTLSNMYVDTLRIMGGSNYSIYAALSPNGITAGGKTISWADLVSGGSGGTAVFG